MPNETRDPVEIVARAQAEAAGFAWEACAQEQWRRDVRAGIAVLNAAGWIIAKANRIGSLLEIANV